MALVVTVAGVARTSTINEDTIRLSQLADAFAFTAELEIFDENSDISITAGSRLVADEISIVDGATTYFGGYVTNQDITTFLEGPRKLSLQCQGYGILLAETLVESETYSAEADDAIIDDLFNTYLPAIDSVTHVAQLDASMDIEFSEMSMADIMDALCERTGGRWYIDNIKALHYFADENDDCGFDLSDTPAPPASYTYHDDPEKRVDGTQIINRVRVIGADEYSITRNDAGSQATYGIRGTIITDQSLTTTAELEERGDAILLKYKDPRVTYVVRTAHGGAVAGQEVDLKCVVLGLAALTVFTIRELYIYWELGEPVYEMVLGEAEITALQRAGGVSGYLRSVIVNPPLPLSARGWGHDLVFSATDHDTVAWSAGTITTAGGVGSFSIDAGNTGNMAATTYVFLDVNVSLTVLQVGASAANAVGAGRILVAVCENVAAGLNAIFLVYGSATQSTLVDTENIVDEAILTAKLADLAVELAKIADGAVDTDKIAANAVTAGKILANTITANEIAAATITAAEIAALTITANEIAAATITTNQIAANTILAANIAAATITGNEINANAIAAGHIQAAAITTAKINDLAVSGSKLSIGDQGIFSAADGKLLLGPGCELTATSWKSLRGQTATIANAFQTWAGAFPGTQGIVMEPGCTNLVANPSFGTNTTGWSELANNTIARSDEQSRYDGYSLKCTFQDQVYAGFYAITLTAAIHYLTAWIFVPSDWDGGSIYLLLANFTGSSGSTIIKAWVPGTDPVGQWIRISCHNTPVAGDLAGHIQIITTGGPTAGRYIYLDGFQVEADRLTTTAIGSMAWCDWSGAAHGSTTVRVGTTMTIPTAGNISASKGSIEMWFRIPTAFNPSGGYLFRAGNVNQAFDAYVAGGTVVYYLNGVLQCDHSPVSIGVDHCIVFGWEYEAGVTDYSELYFDGALVDTGAIGGAAPTLGANMGIGYNPAGSGTNLCGVITEYAVFGDLLTAAEVAAIWNLRREMVDHGAVDAPGIYITDGKFRISSSYTGNRIEITADEIAGYSGATKQFYLQASDGAAYAGGGTVALNEDGIEIEVEIAYADLRSYKFVCEDAVVATVSCRKTAAQNAILVIADSTAASCAALAQVRAEAPTGYLAQVALAAYRSVGVRAELVCSVSVAGVCSVDANIGGSLRLEVVEAGANVTGCLAISDGIAAPGALAGMARLYVDSADGDLKVVFANGFVATIAADS